MPAALKKVLFVDDNLQFLEMIERLMGDWGRNEWQIFTAQNAGKALLVLQEQNIDLAVIDVQMPVVDGIQFLALLNRKYPNVQKVTLSAYADDDSRAACISHGAELFLDKPRDPADLEIIFTTLRELARQKPSTSGFRGVLRQVSLQDVIQMECLNRNSSILEVNAGKWRGQIFIKEGALVHAEAGDRNGEAALNKILSLKGGEFNLRTFTEPARQTIDGSWEFLLMEAARARDEAGEAEPEELPPTADEIPPAPLPRPAPPVRTPSGPASVLAAPGLPGVGRAARVDEMIVCSAKGEVLYEWQCRSAGDRVSFLEFLSRKSSQLGEGLNLGDFDRLEMEGDRDRVIAQIKKIAAYLSTQAAPRAPVFPPIDYLMQEPVHNWLSDKMKTAGLLACALRAPDRKTFTRSLSPQFPQVALENACRCLSDTFQVIQTNRFPGEMIRWVYENYFLYGVMRKDGHCLALLTRRNTAPAMATGDLEKIIAEFQTLAT